MFFRLLFDISRYATVLIVIFSPLFFLPISALSPQLSYYVTVAVLLTMALGARLVYCLKFREWPTVKTHEVVISLALVIAVLISSVLSPSVKSALFGVDVSPYAGMSIIMLPALVYLVRTLPEPTRRTLKKVLLFELVVAFFFFLSALFLNSMSVSTYFFGGFVSPLALTVYLGVTVIVSLSVVFVKSVRLPVRALAGLIGIAVAATLVLFSGEGEVRPSLISSLHVAKQVALKEGLFGVGSGNFVNAWQLYRPQAINDTQFFAVEFIQGLGTTTTYLVTLGVIGFVAVIAFLLFPLVRGVRAWRESAKEEKFILGTLLTLYVYLFIASFVTPLAFNMMVLLVVIGGLLLSRLRHSGGVGKGVLLYLVPIFILMVAHSATLVVKVQAFTHHQNAVKYAEKGKLDASVSELEKSLALFPTDTSYRGLAEAHIALARINLASSTLSQQDLISLYKQGTESAIQAGISAASLRPNNYQNHMQLGRAYELSIPLTGEVGYVKAKEAYEKAITLYPNNPYLYVIKARLDASYGNKSEAKETLSKALSKREELTEALYLMSQLAASEQDVKAAVEYAIKASTQSPNDPAVLTQLGLLLYGSGAYKESFVTLQRALTLDPTNGTVAYFIALSLRDGGRPDLAREVASALLKDNPDNPDLEQLLGSLAVPTQAATSTKKK